LGERKDELGGSEFYNVLGHVGANVPRVDLEKAKNEIYAVIDAINEGLIESAHDISEGGLLITLAEMTMPNPHTGGGNLGLRADITQTGTDDLKVYQKAFSETGGFVVEVKPENTDAFKKQMEKYRVNPIPLGEVTADPGFEISHDGEPLITQFLSALQETWLGSLAEKLK